MNLHCNAHRYSYRHSHADQHGYAHTHPYAYSYRDATSGVLHCNSGRVHRDRNTLGF